ncbi:innexin, putative [Schistosoma mansoni]|uniref:innexin, putative n=1 Tax=Schistosoma mansoni TaxID=6183 RepID=UPI0001A63C62|nr:innexin, putative [Schistosoma mansoni]|eukprot:XP_018645869.1 innexin, putative [Schistosoma mansoni]
MFESSVLNGLTRLSIEIGSSKSRTDDDFIDRINHSHTTTVLMICTLIIMGRQFIGKPIACWTPNEFTSAQVEYATLVCWVTSTYFISPDQPTIPSDLPLRRKDSIHYYQWVPFLLMLQAAMFSIPCIIWRLFNWQSRIHLWTVMDLASKAGDLEETLHSSVNHLEYIVKHLEDALIIRHLYKQSHKNNSSISIAQTSVSSSMNTNEQIINKDNSWYAILPLTITNRSRIPGPRPCSPQSNSYLNGLYLIIKALYVFNSTGQLFLLASFLGQTTIFFGPQMLIDLIAGTQWYQSGNFPRVTFCDLDMRKMGKNYHRYTLQCVLSINMFNEKIFIFLWFWLICISLINIHSFLRWCCRQQSTTIPLAESLSSECYNEQLSINDKKASAFFTEHILGQDGVFVLRLIALNVGQHIASKIACLIWDRYRLVNNTSNSIRQLSNIVQTPPIPERKDKIKHNEESNQSTSSLNESDHIVRIRTLNVSSKMEQYSQSLPSQSSIYSSRNSFNNLYDHCSHSDRNSSNNSRIRILNQPNNFV